MRNEVRILIMTNPDLGVSDLCVRQKRETFQSGLTNESRCWRTRQMKGCYHSTYEGFIPRGITGRAEITQPNSKIEQYNKYDDRPRIQFYSIIEGRLGFGSLGPGHAGPTAPLA